MFKVIRIDKNPDYRAELCSDLSEADLPVGEVTVRVRYSTLNYKDALSGSGHIPWAYVVATAGYAGLYTVAVLALGLLSFRRVEIL